MRTTAQQIDQQLADIEARMQKLDKQREALLCEKNALSIQRYHTLAESLLEIPNGARHLPVVQEDGQGRECNNRLGTIKRVCGGVVLMDFGGDIGEWQTTVYDIVPNIELQVTT